MAAASANGITIEYEAFGHPGSEPVLLIMGLGCQLTMWDRDFCDALAGLGHYVIRYDHRDVGRSTWFDTAGLPDLLSLLLGGATAAPYTLADMADDAAGLLDALGIASAHIVGVSMGGMIAQTFAIANPERTQTLVSAMSSTGDRTVGQPRPEALATLVGPMPETRDEAVERDVSLWRVIGSPGYPFDERMVRDRAAAAYDRAFHPAGTLRHLAAILCQPDRTPALAHLRVPTLVVHGDADPLVDVTGGKATAAAIPGARLEVIPGMGHDIPRDLFGELVSALTGHFRQGDRAPRT